MSVSHRIWNVGSGARLSGTAPIHGNKNAALPCIAAGLLLPVGQSLEIQNVPRISDVMTLCDIVAVFGVSSRWSGPSSLILTRESYEPRAPDVPHELASRIRGSIVLLGALAAQYPSFRIAKPGGDRIGGRPITAHVTALQDIGFSVTDEPGALFVQRMSRELNGGTVLLIEQSVTATLMLLLYSSCLGPDRHLTIMNAACEPHIVTLCLLLEALGARIDGLASNLVTITWPRGIQTPSVPVRLDDDFMEAATYAVAAAVTRSDLAIPFANAALYLNLIDRYLGWMGIRTRLERHAWYIAGAASPRSIDPSLHVIKAEPWPRFPTDVMSMFVVLATQCSGTLKFVEYMYDDRFGFVQSLRDMGARISIQPPHAIEVTGPTQLRSDELFLRPDIRSGAAMLLAALAGDGESVLHDHRNVIERGYQDLPQQLAALGARITEVR